MIAAVVFDLDGVLIQTEEVWDDVREAFAGERGARYDADAQRAMMGMSSLEWSLYMHEELGVPDEPEDISAEVVRRMEARYRERLPLIDGAEDAVRRLAARWPLGLASSSNRPLIDAVLELSGLVTVLSGDRLLGGGRARQALARRLPRVRAPTRRRPASACAAVEDSHSGIRSAKAAGMRVIAIPNPSYPPDDEALAQADVVLGSLAELTPEAVERT